MRRTRSKKILAGFLALTLFLTSGFLILFRDSVFGAKNKANSIDPNPYVDTDSDEAVSVTVRGNKKGEVGTVILTNEGSNQKDKIPNTFYKGWDFSYPLTDENGNVVKDEFDNEQMVTITIPSTEGKKGTEGNPFTIVEVVPDKQMQEMSYLVGGADDSGLGYDEGYMSATLMEKLRKKKNDPSFRFTNKAFLLKKDDDGKLTPTNPEERENFIKNNIINSVKSMYGRWMIESNYNVFGMNAAGNEENDPSHFMKAVDCDPTEGENVAGDYAFNKLYSVEVTTDDLLQVLPTKLIKKWGDLNSEPTEAEIANEKRENKWVYFDYSSRDGYFEREYTDDLIAFVASQKGKTVKQLTTKDIEDYIKDELSKVQLNSVELTDAQGGKTNHATEIVKYNLKEFSQSDEYAPGIGQDVTWNDYKNSKAFDEYDISQSLIYRGATYDTRHYELKKREEKTPGDGLGDYAYLGEKLPVTNYWKVQFRKKYIDTFTQYFSEYKAADAEWREVEPSDTNALSDAQKEKFDDRNQKLERLMKTFAPFFEKKGVNPKTMSDPANWTTGTKTVLSDVRKYKVQRAGGYIMAVKPGMGDMYLLNDEEIKNITNKMTDEEKEAIGGVDINKLFVFSRDDKDSNANEDGDVGRPLKERRWLFVPSTFVLEGDMATGKDATYRSGYLDDSKYTFGFASKTIKNKNEMKLAIFDRYNRRHHGTYSGQAGNKNLTTGDFKDWFKTTGDVGSNKDKDIEKFSKKMLYYTDKDNIAGINDNGIFSTYKRGGTATTTDKYHLNVWNEIHKDRAPDNVSDDDLVTNSASYGLGVGLNSQRQKDIDGFDNLINSDGQGFFGNLGNKWLFSNRGADYITGLTFNFHDLVLSTDNLDRNTEDPNYVIIPRSKKGEHPYVQVKPDIYNEASVKGKVTREMEYNEAGSTRDTVGYDYLSATYKHPVFLESLSGNSFSSARGKVEGHRFQPDDDVVQVDRDVSVRETVTNFTFSYYGFKANPVIQRSLFTFVNEEEFDNFHCRVVVVTPSELNMISKAAKDFNLDFETDENKTSAKNYELRTLKGEFDINADDSDSVLTTKKNGSASADAVWASTGWTPRWKNERLTEEEKTNLTSGKLDLGVRLDLIERADMFYFHTNRSSRKTTSVLYSQDHTVGNGTNNDDVDLVYEFYKEVVEQNTNENGEADASGATKDNFYKMDTFFENDLEWDQVMKLIKRSSLDEGINIPILFNLLVGIGAETSVDSDDNSEAKSSEDVHMALFNKEDKTVHVDGVQDTDEFVKYTLPYSGNVCNMAKLYTILTQFDLHAKRGAIVNPEETDPSKQRVVRRSFMGDIFDKISQVPINPSYKPSDESREEESAKMTGIVPEMSVFDGSEEGQDRTTYNKKDYRSRIRVLCQKSDDDNEQFRENSRYLWNKYTFYPFDIVTERDQRAVLMSETTDFFAKKEENEEKYNKYNELRLRFLEWGYLETYYTGADAKYPIFTRDQPADQAIRRRVGTNGEDSQNVFVLHWPGSFDNLNAGQSLLGHWGDEGKAPQTNLFTNIAYKIMSYPGKFSSIEVKARPRDKVYTLMGRDENGHDHILLDYYRNSGYYTASELNRLKDEEKNVLVSVFNANSEPAFVTSVSLHRSEEDVEEEETPTPTPTPTANPETDTSTTDDEEEVEAETDDTEEIVPVYLEWGDEIGGRRISLSDLLKKNNETKVTVETNYPVEGQTATHQPIVQGNGVLVKGGSTIFFHVPYKLSDFFDEGDTKGYDRIKIYGYYYVKNQKDQTMSIKGFTRTIDIDERELFDLE